MNRPAFNIPENEGLAKAVGGDFLLRVKLAYSFLYSALSCAEGWLTIDFASRNMS